MPEQPPGVTLVPDLCAAEHCNEHVLNSQRGHVYFAALMAQVWQTAFLLGLGIASEDVSIGLITKYLRKGETFWSQRGYCYEPSKGWRWVSKRGDVTTTHIFLCVQGLKLRMQPHLKE